MKPTAFNRSIEPFTASDISYFRTQLRCGAAGHSTAPRIAPAQSLLLFSLSYGAGASPFELSRMPVSSLLTADGDLASEVRFDRLVARHRFARRVAMHPDVARDLLAFRHFFPEEQWIAFRATPRVGAPPSIAASSIVSWFRASLREAGLGRFTIASARKAYSLGQRLSA